MRRPLALLASCVVVACSGGDPGGQSSTQDDGGVPGFTFTGPGASDDGGTLQFPTPNPTPNPNPTPTPTPMKDSGAVNMNAPDTAPPPVDDPIVPGTLVPNPSDAFSGAGKYKSDPPAIRANDQHSGMVVTGKSCLDCHNGTICVQFDFAGTVWMAPDYTQGAADVEVREIDANNYAYDVHSDVDGNFWHRADTALALPALSGVRTASWDAVGQLNGTSCNSCHYAGNTDPAGPPGPQLFVQP